MHNQSNRTPSSILTEENSTHSRKDSKITLSCRTKRQKLKPSTSSSRQKNNASKTRTSSNYHIQKQIRNQPGVYSGTGSIGRQSQTVVEPNYRQDAAIKARNLSE